MFRVTIIAAALLLPIAASAVDTWESYPEGPAAFEFYVGRAAQGETDAATTMIMGPAWGLDESTHAYFFLGLRSLDVADPAMAEGLDFMALGLFRNLYGGWVKPLKVDAWAEISAAGLGAGSSCRRAGLEVNLDGEKVGLMARPSWGWFHDFIEDEMVDMSLAWDLAAWVRFQEKTQIFVQRSSALNDGSLRDASWLVGINRVLSEKSEIVAELRKWDMSEGFDLSLGLITVW